MKFKLRIIHQPFTIGNLFKYKDKQELLHCAGVVYQLTCSYGRKYVGQSKRNLIFRIIEYQPSTTHQTDSKVTHHLLENPQHIINFKEPKILAKENH